MRFRHQRPEEVSVNITPLIDVVFILLIFFMISTTFKKESHIELSLPKASSELAQSEQKKIEIIIGAQGAYAVNGMALLNNDTGTLKRAINKVSTDTQLRVIISADAQAPHQAVVSAMDVAGQLGFSRLSITTLRENSSE